MKLLDLEPTWLTSCMFMFKCPDCQKKWLSCKRAHLTAAEQFAIARRANISNRNFVYTEYAAVWTFEGEGFDNITVTQSINAAPAGHWHGYITKGEIITSEAPHCVA